MKKGLLVSVALCSLVGMLASCGGNSGPAELAVVTDVGQLMDGGFNQGTYEGVKGYAEANGKTYQYYQPANGSNATDADRVEAMESAIKNGARVIVAPGFLQAKAMTQAATDNPDVDFVFVDGWALSDKDNNVLNNVTAITYKEQEAGFMAGYAVVMDGYTKLGGTFGGGGSNPACNRFAYGFAQGANAAALIKQVDVEFKVSFKFGSGFSASADLQTQISGWYTAGTEIVFSCGGSMVNSVIAAANGFENAKIVGVDTDQHALSDKIVTSAMKGLAPSVEKVLGQYYAGKWNDIGGKAQNLGASDDATGLPTDDAAWRFKSFTKEQYNSLFADIKSGKIIPLDNVAENCDTTDFWSPVDALLLKEEIILDK